MAQEQPKLQLNGAFILKANATSTEILEFMLMRAPLSMRHGPAVGLPYGVGNRPRGRHGRGEVASSMR